MLVSQNQANLTIWLPEPVNLWIIVFVDTDQQASADELRAAIDMGRKQYQPKQLK